MQCEAHGQNEMASSTKPIIRNAMLTKTGAFFKEYS
jgi:hypothetical protein